jgi:redox-regulated HSP33 family molecular chaperone
MILKLYTEEREQLEKAALDRVCACLYYDLADCIDAMSDDEVKDIIENGAPCDICQA